MPLTYEKTLLGKIRIQQERNGAKTNYTLEIRQGNVDYGVCIWVGRDGDGNPVRQLMGFFADDQHCRNMIRNHGNILCGERVLRAELNMYYEKNYKLLKYMMQSGWKVTCYYKAPKGAK